ncbi:LOW QUALITY PROTEIN: NAD-dependent epimerase/dehydratase, partial [Dillenia turbinata]
IRERKSYKFRVSNQSQKVVQMEFHVEFCANLMENQMTVSVTGATGFIGRRLVQRLHKDNHKIHVLTRSRSKAQLIFPAKDFPHIMIAEETGWKDCIQGSNAVVNLAGMPISTRWSPEQTADDGTGDNKWEESSNSTHLIKKEIKESRIRVTSKACFLSFTPFVGYYVAAGEKSACERSVHGLHLTMATDCEDLINVAKDGARPAVLVSATAIGYYGTSETQVFDENSPSGNDYLAQICREWEATALKVNKDVRVALIRIGIVLGKDGGALAKMIPLFMMFAGGPLGSGKQWFSWIHLDDIVSLIYEALTNPSYTGEINGTAPNPVRLSEMCDHLGNVMGRPSWLPVPEFALKVVLGEGASVVLEGQKVLPSRAKELGFPFKYPYVKDALKAILSEA